MKNRHRKLTFRPGAQPGTGQMRPNAGFTLIEILVTLFILLVGLLGLAGLQARGLQGNQGAVLRAQATHCAADILDRLRANRSAALHGDYQIGRGEAPTTPTYSGVVLQDLVQWKNSLKSSLPAGDGSISLNGNLVTITVSWTEPLGQQTMTVEARP